jgi:hypothetical protein
MPGDEQRGDVTTRGRTRLSRHSESADFQITLKLLGLFSRDSHKGYIPPDDEDIHIAIGPELHVCHGVQIDDEILCGRDEFAHLRLMFSPGEGKSKPLVVVSARMQRVTPTCAIFFVDFPHHLIVPFTVAESASAETPADS